jgi:hypothetical protein
MGLTVIETNLLQEKPMGQPTLTDYAHLIMTLFDKFVQTKPVLLRYQNLCTYQYREMMLFFMLMQFRRIYEFKAQHRWLEAHPEIRTLLGFQTIPDRTTLSRQYKKLGPVLTAFTAFIGDEVADLDEAFANRHLAEDKSLFKADGPVWHQSDRREGRIPPKLRRLDTDATWGKSGYQGWVYGYGLHITCTEAAFPKLLEVETAAVADSQVLDQKADFILHHLQPASLTADDRYTKARRIRHWIGQGTLLITPPLRWVKGRYAQAYHRFLAEADIQQRFKKRKTSVEPLFDLIAKVIGTTGQQKQLPIQRLVKVRTVLALGVLTVQIAMIMNSILGLPLREISAIKAAFS